jgi:hypothetical protein
MIAPLDCYICHRRVYVGHRHAIIYAGAGCEPLALCRDCCSTAQLYLETLLKLAQEQPWRTAATAIAK